MLLLRERASLCSTISRLPTLRICANALTQIQILVATSTLAWGVNTPAHLVIIKGTEVSHGVTRVTC